MRQRVVPTNPNTIRQQMVRSYLGASNAAYAALSVAEKAAWTTYAQNMPRTDSLGNVIVLTGQQMYAAWYVPNMQAGPAYSSDIGGPTIFDNGISPVAVTAINAGTPNVIGMETGSLSMNIEYAPSGGAVGAAYSLYIGRPVGTTINFYKGPYQIACSGTFIEASGNIDVTDVVNTLTIDEALVEGQIRPLRVKLFMADGRVGQTMEFLAEVVDDPVA